MGEHGIGLMRLLSTTTIGMMANQTTMTISTIVQRSMKLSEMTMLVRGMTIYVVTSMDSFAKRNEYLDHHQIRHQEIQPPQHLSQLLAQQLPPRPHLVLVLERKLLLQFVFCF